ncbi:hypothetical protein M3Y99_00874200 [Aphelenchoides fujianensis]|nr:hypothetical protein M3Y99_00874200 [Aphelenchoides fujianensis]
MDARGRCSKRRSCPYLHRALYSTTDFDQDFLPPPLDPPNIPPLMPLFVPNGGGDYATPAELLAAVRGLRDVAGPSAGGLLRRRPGFATPPPDYRTLPAWSPPMGACPPTPSYYVMYCAHVLPAGSPPTVLLPPEMNLTICASMTPPY